MVIIAAAADFFGEWLARGGGDVENEYELKLQHTPDAATVAQALTEQIPDDILHIDDREELMAAKFC